MANREQIKPGTTFRSVIADCNALWKVLKRQGTNAYLCEVINEPQEYDGRIFDSDYAGHQDLFQREHIFGSINMKNIFAELGNKHDGFYANLTPGEIVHYSSSHGRYVRCTVTSEQELLPIALVGEWYDWEYKISLSESNEPLIPSQVKRIIEKETMTPNYSNIYESPGFPTKPHDLDPRKEKPLKLDFSLIAYKQDSLDFGL
jgi:hypothetical protein